MLPFFGLHSSHSIQLHSQIFDMVNYGNGFTVMDLYQMPTKLRIFYYQKLVEAKKKEAEQVNNSQKQMQANKVRIKR